MKEIFKLPTVTQLLPKNSCIWYRILDHVLDHVHAGTSLFFLDWKCALEHTKHSILCACRSSAYWWVCYFWHFLHHKLSSSWLDEVGFLGSLSWVHVSKEPQGFMRHNRKTIDINEMMQTVTNVEYDLDCQLEGCTETSTRIYSTVITIHRAADIKQLVL